MGNQLSNALKALGEGLSTIAVYRAGKEEKADERAYQKEMREGQNAFQQRLLELQQAHSDKALQQNQEFQAAEREDRQLFDSDMFDKRTAIEDRRFAQEMSARWAGIRAQVQAAGGSANDRQLTRQLGVYEKQIEMAASEYSGIQKQMNEEMKALGDDKMLSLRPEQMEAAKDEIMQRYQPQLQEARQKIDEGMKTYSSAVGIEPKAEFSGVAGSTKTTAASSQEEAPMTGGMAATGSALNEERVTQAVEAAQMQLRSGTMPSEANLVAGFEKAGLSRAEAIKAARQLQRTQFDGLTRDR